MSEQYARTLIKRYLAGQCNSAERALVEQYFNEELRAKQTLPTTQRVEQADHRMLQALMKHLTVEQTRPANRIWRWLPYAAALLIGVGTVTWYFLDKRPIEQLEVVGLQSSDIPPGGNRATLILADGRSITLDEAQDGIIIGGGAITYNDGNLLADVEGSTDGRAGMPLLELSTPKGGTYQVTLPDGTRVWLNAASTLKYPSRFSSTARVVELSGEAYFSVAKESSRPFKVVSSGQEVLVLGTEFNITAYADEKKTKTTLVEGAVRLFYLDKDKAIDLSPGEQGVLQEDGIKKHNVDLFAVTAWKSGRFSFNNKSFAEIMNEMARWYNIDVEYEGSVPENNFIGDAYRTDNLSTVLRFLENSDIQHKLERGVGGRYRLIIRNEKEVTPQDF